MSTFSRSKECNFCTILSFLFCGASYICIQKQSPYIAIWLLVPITKIINLTRSLFLYLNASNSLTKSISCYYNFTWSFCAYPQVAGASSDPSSQCCLPSHRSRGAKHSRSSHLLKSQYRHKSNRILKISSFGYNHNVDIQYFWIIK